MRSKRWNKDARSNSLSMPSANENKKLKSNCQKRLRRRPTTRHRTHLCHDLSGRSDTWQERWARCHRHNKERALFRIGSASTITTWVSIRSKKKSTLWLKTHWGRRWAQCPVAMRQNRYLAVSTGINKLTPSKSWETWNRCRRTRWKKEEWWHSMGCLRPKIPTQVFPKSTTDDETNNNCFVQK